MIVGTLALGLFAQVVPDAVTDVVDTTYVSTWDPLWAGVAVIVGALLAYVARVATRSWGHRVDLPANIVDLSVTLVTWSIVGLSLLVALGFLGLSVTWIWLVALLLLVAFIVGGRVLMESFGAGVMLQARAPFAPGDLVRAGGHRGIVEEVNSRVVVLNTVDGQKLFLPNKLVLSEPIANMSQAGRRMSCVLLDVAYGTDLDLARELATESLVDVEEVLKDPPPVAQVSSFEASAVRIGLRFWHAPDVPGEWAAVDAASRAAYAAFAAGDIEFAFPQQTLWWGEAQDPGA